MLKACASASAKGSVGARPRGASARYREEWPGSRSGPSGVTRAGTRPLALIDRKSGWSVRRCRNRHAAPRNRRRRHEAGYAARRRMISREKSVSIDGPSPVGALDAPHHIRSAERCNRQSPAPVDSPTAICNTRNTALKCTSRETIMTNMFRKSFEDADEVNAGQDPRRWAARQCEWHRRSCSPAGTVRMREAGRRRRQLPGRPCRRHHPGQADVRS